ncbi:MAG: hypothetical protein PHP03_03645 [Candidatus Pacebacteria bacterium]|nr:hypothetical protein [Candidatus Paceibacterota bacterium]
MTETEKERRQLQILMLNTNKAIDKKNARKKFWSGLRGFITLLAVIIAVYALIGAVESDNTSPLKIMVFCLAVAAALNLRKVIGFLWTILENPYQIAWSRCVRTFRKNGW